MKNLRAFASQAAMGTLLLSITGGGMLMVESSLAQSSVNGSWNVNAGAWGTLTNWSYAQPMRATQMTVTLNPGPLVTVVRKGDKLDAVELQNVVGAGGSGYTKTPTVIVSDPGANGRPAVVRANLDIDNGVDPGDTGSIISFSVIDAGSGYTGTPTVTITREIAGLVVTDPGSGYSKPPLIEFSGGGAYASNSPPAVAFRGGLGGGAVVVPTIAGGIVASFTYPNRGSGYSSLKPPTASFVTTTGGSGAAAAVQLGVSAQSFTINSGTTTYSVAPTVTINAPTGVVGTNVTATATANLNANGLVTGVTITNQGKGYIAAPSISFTGGTVLVQGTDPTGTGKDNQFVIGELHRTNNGSGYSNVEANAPSIVISQPAPDNVALGTAIVEDGRVVAVEINDGGIGYTTPPQIIFSGGTGAVGNGGVYATSTVSDGEVVSVSLEPAHASVPSGGGAGGADASTAFSPDPEVAKFGAINSVTLSSGGQGYTSLPVIAIGATLRRTATATTSITGGVVTAVNMGNHGSGYIATPAVTFSTTRWLGYTSAPRVRFVSNGVTGAVATATRTGDAITALVINDNGAGYPSIPTVTIVGGSGTGAAGTAIVVGGGVNAVNMTNQGTGYNVVPTVVFTGGGGTGAKATASIVGGRVNAITMTSPGSGYTSAPFVSFISGTVADPATAVATVTAGRVTALSLTHNGTGYTGTPTVVFTVGGVTFGTATATVAAGRLNRVAITYPGSGYSTPPDLSFTGGLITGGTQATATTSITAGKLNDAVTIVTPGGADPAQGTAVMNPNGTVDSINLVSGGNGYLSAPPVTIGDPTGVNTPVMLAPGGQGSFIQFNRDIGGNSTITLDDSRVVGSLAIGDTGGEDYILNSGTGGTDSSLTFAMGAIGGGKSFLNKLQGDQDVINAPVILTDELNVRINAGRLTLAGGIIGTGDLVLSGNSVLTVRGTAPTSNLTDLWLWHRGFSNAGAQIELGVSGGPGFANIRLGNASAGTVGYAVLQLLQDRGAGLADPTPFLDQINDNARIIVDGITNRWGYFKLMGGDETIGSIQDVGNALVLENMEGETVNSDAVLTLGGDNLDSYIGGYIRNRSGGSGTGTIGITKNGTGDLMLAGGNINYTGDTLLNGGALRLFNTTNFNSRIVAVTGTTIEVETAPNVNVNFDNDVVGDSEFRKLGAGTLSFNSGQLSLDDFFMTAGSVTVRSGASTLRGGGNTIEQSFIVRGDNGADKSVRIADSLSVGFVQAEGRFGQAGSQFNIFGERLSVSNRGYYRDGVLESSGAIEVTNMIMRLVPSNITDNRSVAATTPTTAAPSTSTTVVLNDVNNLIIGSVMTLTSDNAPDTVLRNIPQNTRITAVNLVTRAVTLDKGVRLVQGTNVTFVYSSQTDGAVRGESLNFADVVYDGRKFVAVTSKGTIHTSLTGTVWTQVYEDVLGLPLESLSWTGERYVAVGVLGRVITSGAGNAWVSQSTGISTTLRGVTGTEVAFTGDIVSGSAVVLNVANGTTFLPGMTVVGNATAPDTRIVSTSVTGSNVSVVVDGAALAAGTEVDFGYFKGTTTITAPNARTITNVRTAHLVPTGIVLTGSVNGIPAGAVINATSGPNSTITLNMNATASPAGVDLFTMEGDTTAGSDMITNLTNTSGLAVGMIIKGSGIPTGARVTAINTAGATVTLSVKTPVNRAGVPLSIFTGRLSSGSPTIQDVTSATSFTAGMTSRGRLLPANTKVLASTANSVTLTNQASGTATTASLLAVKTVMTRTGSFTSGDLTVNGVSDTTGLVVGMPVSAPGVIPAGTVIQTIGPNPNTITLSNPAMASPVGQQSFNAGFDVVAVGDDGRIMASAGGASDTWVSLPSQITRDLNAITWNGTRLVAVGDNSQVLYSNTGLLWTRQTPPLAESENVIINSSTDGLNSNTITLNNVVPDPVPPATAYPNVSFAAFKGTATEGNAVISGLTGIHILRPKLQVFSPSGLQAGVTVKEVFPATNSMELSAPATATITNAPIQTFTALANTRVISLTGVAISAATDLATKVDHGLLTGDSVTLTTIASGAGLKQSSVYYVIRVSANTFKLAISPADAEFGSAVNVSLNRTGVVITPNPNVLREVSDFKGLMPGMLLHGSALSAPTPIIAMDQVQKTITLASAPTVAGRLGFGVLYGNFVNASTAVTNIRVFPSIQAMSGRTTHLTVNKPVASFPERIGEGVTITAFSSGANTITLSAPAIGTGYVPLYTIVGTTTNGSNLVTDVPAASFSGLSVGQLFYVTGTLEPADTFSVFTILALDSTSGEITLSGPPSLNETADPVPVVMGVFTGLVTSGDMVVRNLSNRLGVPAPILFQPDLQDIIWTGTQFITVGNFGAILTSADGVAWAPQNSGTGHDLNTVGRSGAQFLAAGEDGLIIKSTNGTAWTVARVADDPSLVDVRQVRDLQAIIGTGTAGQTVALGSGGIAATDAAGNDWAASLSVNNTFSGTQTFLTIAGKVGGGGGLTLSNDHTTTPGTTTPGGVLVNANNPNRIDDGLTLQSRGGTMIFENNAAQGISFSETIGKLLLDQGHMQLQAFQAAADGTATLTFGSLEARPGAVLEFLSRDKSGGSAATLLGSIGGTGARNRVMFTQNPILDDKIIGGFVTIDNEWASYDPVEGVIRLAAADYENPLNADTQWTSTDNVKMVGGSKAITAAVPVTLIGRAINSLLLNGTTLNLDGRRLSIESGGILVPGSSTIQGTSANLLVGAITRGAAKDTEAVLNIIGPGSLTMNTRIVDYISEATVGAHAIGASVLTLPATAMVGLVAGMEVAGGGAAIPSGTRIRDILPNNQIRLSVPLAQAISAGTILAFTGGPVSLAKSGSGTLVLNAPNSTYTGKTYINNGYVRINSFDALGSAPTSFVQDHLQINGGFLQVTHAPGQVNEPTYNVFLNDGNRGLTIGIAGGRLEVGEFNPNNDGSGGGTRAPEINLTITNPINAIGVLELAVRNNSAVIPEQTNSITLGTSSSHNIYRAGIKTEGGYEGVMNINGDNEIGGIFSEGGTLNLIGDNNFTASIRSLKGNITIEGSNTWRGTTTWGDPVDFRSGRLILKTPDALGTGGLNLAMGDTAELALAGISQRLRLFTSTASSVISNATAPDNLVGATPVIFDLDRNQTFAGIIRNGLTLSGSAAATLKLVKQGPGTLNLTNSTNGFSGGVEILEGAINVTSIGNINTDSALGKVFSSDPALLLIDKSVLSITPSSAQSTDRSFTMGSGPYGATIAANGTIQEASVTLGLELRDAISGTTQLSTPIAFNGAGTRTLTLSGTGRGDNKFLLELGDSSATDLTSLFKASSGNWVLGKANTYSGLTTIQEGSLVVTRNDALGTKGRAAIVNQGDGTFTSSSHIPDGTPVTFPLFAATTLPGGVQTDVQYYVVGSSGNTFKIATTPGGTALALTSSGANVQFVPKIDSVRSTNVVDLSTGKFSGYAPNGSSVTFSTKLLTGAIVLPSSVTPNTTFIPNTPYYVVNSEDGTFQISLTPGGTPIAFSTVTVPTPDSLFYTTNAVGNAAAGVNLAGGTLELRNVDYITPEQLVFEGGALAVPAGSTASWSGDVLVNANSRITIGANGVLTLNGNLLGSRAINQEGEGTLIMRGETLAPSTNVANNVREYAVRAGTLVLDYTLNNASKLVDSALLRLGGTRRGGTVVLSGGSHEEIVSQLNLEAGASKIYRDSNSSSTIRLNTAFRSAGSSLYVDVGRIAKIDNPNINGMLGAWAIIRNALTNAYVVIPGTSTFTYTVTANAATDNLQTSVANVVRKGMVATFTSTGTLPGNLQAGVPYYVMATSGNTAPIQVSETLGGSRVNILPTGSGVITMTVEQGILPNAATDSFSTLEAHGLADGVPVRLKSYDELPAGLAANIDYYVVSCENRTFQLSLTLGGPPVSFSNNGEGALVLETQGAQRRAGPVALTFSIDPDFAAGSDGNNRIKIMIENTGAPGGLSSTLTGQGTVADPYIYTIKTTTSDSANGSQAIASFVKGDQTHLPIVIGNIITVAVSPSELDTLTGGNFAMSRYLSTPDTGSFGAPAGVFLAHGSFDNGSTELDWARNEGTPGSETLMNDGFIMPSGSGLAAWGLDTNTSITGNLDVAAAGSPLNTFSVRFADRVGATVNLLGSGLYPIRTGGILVSPTVGANDSTFTGSGVLTTENQGNLQNFVMHQYNQLGALIINNRITNRVAQTRTARLTGQSRRYLSMNASLLGTQLAPDWTVPATTGINPGISANTRIESLVQNRLIILGSNHDGTLRLNQVYVFSSPGAVALNADTKVPDGHPSRTQITGLSSTADIVTGMTVTGPGIALGTVVNGIINSSTVLLNQQVVETVQAGAYIFTDGVTVINRPGIVNDPNRFLITGMFSTAGLTVGMSVTGPGISIGTTIAEVSTNPAQVRLSNIHDGEHRVGVNFTFDGNIVKAGTLPVTRALLGSSSDPNRRILDGVTRTSDLTVGALVTGAGIPAATTIELILDNHTVYLSQYHDGGFRRGNYTFGNKVYAASVPNADRRIVMGIAGGGTVSTNDLYIGMPITGPGIPFGSTITFIYNDSDIQVSTNHFFTAESTTLTFTPTTGVEKLGPGMLALTGASDYTGVTFIADGTLRANLLTDGGVAGSLGASNGGSGNLVFNGGELQYVGENSQTNRGFTVADFATLNVGHERTTATFSGVITSGADRLNKAGPGTLELNGNANLAAMRVQQGRLLLQTVDTNPAPGAFSPSNFSQSALTSLILGGGTLELRGAPEGNVTQNFGSQITIEAGATTLKVTSVPASDPLSLTAPFTRLNIMGQEEITPVIRQGGGTVHFVENPTGNGAADIYLYLPNEERQQVIPWATYQDTTNILSPGVNQFATVLRATGNNELTGGEVVSAGAFGFYEIGSGLINPMSWLQTRTEDVSFDVSEGALSPTGGPLALNGEMTENRYVRTLRFVTPVDGVINIVAGKTLELLGGAILTGSNVAGGTKSITGDGNITGGALNDVNSDLIMHNYNAVTPFTLGANIIDRSITSTSANGLVGKGEVKLGEVQMKINSSSASQPILASDFFTRVRPGMKVSGNGIQPGTVVKLVERSFSRLILSLPADGTFANQIYTFTDTTNFIQTGIGTTILAGNNTYTGTTFVHGGVLRLNSANAIPGGIASTGGTSALVVEDGIIGLGAGDFTRKLGTGISEIQFSGNGGFAAYDAERTVNLGGAAVPETLRFGNNSFVPDGSSLILGSHDATHKLIFANPLDLSAFSQAIRVENSPIAVEAELTGSLSGLGRMIKFGLGTLRLATSNVHQGGIEIAEGRLIAANVANVFGTSSGAVRLGSSITNTTSQTGIDLVVEGGTVANPLLVGAVNARGALWTAGGVVESTQGDPSVGAENSAAIVSGYPAFAYYDSTNQDLKYVRALDARGTAWGVPVTVSSRGNVGRNPSLQIINGNPAITYHDETAGMLMYVRCTDAQGVVWGTPISVLGQTSPAAVAVDASNGIIVGGAFTRFDGEIRNRLVRLLPPTAQGDTTWRLDPAFNANIMNGEVRTIVVLPDGRILVGGTFTTVRETKTSTTDTNRNRIAVFNGTTGNLDVSVNPNSNGDVRTFVRQSDGKIMVGGSFTTIAGVSRTRMARLNANITLDTSFGFTDIRNGEVRAIIPEDTNPDVAGFESYAIAGSFTDIRGGGNRNRLARINADAGLASTFNPDANNVVQDMVRLPSGKFLVGGTFTAFTGGVIARTRLARLNSDGAVDETFGQEVNGEVRDLHLEANGDVLVAGIFSRLGDFDRSFIGRVLADGNVDTGFAPEPDNEVRQIATTADGKIVLAGTFNTVSTTTQQLVARILPTGANDPGFTRSIINAGLYTSLCSVNGNPAIAYYNSVGNDLFYIRSTDVNGSGWPNPELIDDGGIPNANVGVGISLTIANIGGDLLTKDNRGTETPTDDEVTLSGSVATSGTPVIAYGDATNSTVKYVVANNVNGAGNVGVGLGVAMTNWSLPQPIPGLGGTVGRHFTLNVVDGFPALTYQTANNKDLRYIRALNVAGVTHNLRDTLTLEVLRIPVGDLNITTATSWGTPVTLDSHPSDDLGSYPSLALVNGQPTTTKNRPAVAYYDATRGDLKYVTSADSTGAVWNAPTSIVTVGDVGRSNTLMVTDGLPAVAYYNATLADLEFVILNNASGYSRIAMNDDTVWSGNMTLNGMTTLAPAVGTVTQLTGLISGAAGFRLAGGGTLNIVPNKRTLLMTSVEGLAVGWLISGPGIPLGATLAAIDSFNRTITLDRDHDNVSRTATYHFGLTPGATAPDIRDYDGTVLVGNSFATALKGPGETTGPGRAVDGGIVIRSGTLLFSGANALGNATVELGDQVSQVISVDRATNSTSVLNHGGVFNAKHDGNTINANGPGAFVEVGATIDGHYLGLTATVVDPNANRLTGNLPNDTAIRFRASILPTDIEDGATYYVRGNLGNNNFQISSTLGGPSINFSDAGTNVFFIQEASLAAQILVKDEAANPERNGIYRVVITTDNEELAANKISLVRVAALDSVPEMAFGVRATVLFGTHQEESYYIGSTVTDLNVSAVHWIRDVIDEDMALLANASGLTVGGAIDVNASAGSGSHILGAHSSVTSGTVFFSGPITLQNQSLAAQELETLELTSDITSSQDNHFGVRFTGAITEASSQDGTAAALRDSLALVKTGSGIVTLEGNSSFKGGISIDQGTLYVMNNPAAALVGQSGTGIGPVTVNAGTVLGGIGSIGGPSGLNAPVNGSVTLNGSVGSPAILRPGDPSTTTGTETLTINAPIVVGANSVIEFTIGVANITRLVGTTLNLSTETSTIHVQFANGFNPADGTEFDLLDLTSSASLTVFGGLQNLLNLLILPSSKAWDISQFATTGIIKVVSDPEPIFITTQPVPALKMQGESVTLSVEFTGTGPVSIQWQKNTVPSPGTPVWVDVVGGTSKTLLLSNLTQADEGQYRVRLSNPLTPSLLSDVVNLGVNWPLSFAQDLAPKRSASVGYALTLKVIMNGEGPITYEWLKNGAAISGAPDSDTYTISNIAPEHAGKYRVRVRGPFNAAGILSVESTVTVSASAAVVVEDPVSQTVLAGANVSLSALPGGDDNARVTTWRRNGAAILGEFTNTLDLPGITLAQAGAYTFKVDNKIIATGKASTATSAAANITVVENPNRIVAGQLTKSVTLTANVGIPAGIKPTYTWLKNGQPLIANKDKYTFAPLTKTLVIKNLALTDTDTYTCRITGAAGTAPVIGATHFLRVFTQSPKIVKDTPPPVGMVGSYFSWKIPVTSDVASTAEDPVPAAWQSIPLTYAATGLPNGLKLDTATGYITGRPTVASKIATGDSITFTVKNAFTTGAATSPVMLDAKWVTTLDINPLPLGIAGTYAGPVERSAALNGGLGGRFDMTVTPAGGFSGKVTLGSEAFRSFTGAFANLNLNSAGELVGAPTVSVTMLGTKTAPPLTVTFTLNITPGVSPNPPVTKLISATMSYRANSVNFQAWRNNFAKAAVADVSMLPTAYTGPVGSVAHPYNFAIRLPEGVGSLITNPNVPQGDGYASFTVSTAGTYTLAGRTADGESLTGAYFVGPEGQLFIFQALYTTVPKGSILGNLQIELGDTANDNDLSGTLTWVRPPTPVTAAAAKKRLYKDGFGMAGTPVTSPVNLEAVGGRFIKPPTTTGTIFDPAGTTITNASLEFSEDGDFLPAGADVATASNPNSLGNVTVLVKTSKVTVPVNAAKTALAAVHGTGALSGSFTLTDGKRKGTIMGLTIRVRTSLIGQPRVTDTYGTGYFILDQLPGGTTVPQRSGIFSFTK